MIEHGRSRSTVRPKELDITETKVFVSSNITAFEETIDEQTISGFEFDYVEYDKDEFIEQLTEKSNSLESELTATQLALCEAYEMMLI